MLYNNEQTEEKGGIRLPIGILTGGGDCPGLNTVIRAVALTSFAHQCKLIGFLDGFSGLVENRYVTLEPAHVSGLLHRGGTILGTNNRNDPFRFPVEKDGKIIYRDRSDEAINNLNKLGIQTLIVIGGDGSLAVARDLSAKGAKIVGVPKTIDNDLAATDQTFGFDTAVTVATDALDRLHTTAESHHRVMVLELMGRYAGWIALQSGIAGGADVILIPEVNWSIDKVAQKILERQAQGKSFSLVVVAEGAKSPTGEMVIKQKIAGSGDPLRLGGIGNLVGQLIEQTTNIETRVTTLGHIQRGGSPTPFDRVLATRFGVTAAKLALAQKYGIIVCLQGWQISSVKLERATTKTKNVPLDSQLIQAARAIGISFGD